MIPSLRPTNRSLRGQVVRGPLAFALILTIALGSLLSPLVFAAAEMGIGQEALDRAPLPVQSTHTQSATPTSAATATAAESTPTSAADTDGISVRIYAWECVSGTLTGQPMSYYQGEDQCEGEKVGVVVNVADDTGTLQTTSVKGGRQVDDLDGSIVIAETLPAGYETPAIFCTSLTGQPGEDITGDGPAVTLPSGANTAYQCDFYNIPAGISATGTGDVLVYTYACASIPPRNSNFAWYFQNCTTRQNGATFVLETPDASIESNAGDSIDGAVTMRGLQVGDYALTETAPMPNYEIGAVFCADIGKAELPGPAQMLPQPHSGDTITTAVTADTLVYCHWYQVPTASASPAD